MGIARNSVEMKLERTDRPPVLLEMLVGAESLTFQNLAIHLYGGSMIILPVDLPAPAVQHEFSQSVPSQDLAIKPMMDMLLRTGSAINAKISFQREIHRQRPLEMPLGFFASSDLSSYMHTFGTKLK